MRLKISKNNNYQWTRHSLYKMKQYNLSAQRVSRVIRHPERIEKGIVKNTVAAMQPTSKKIKNGKNIWNQEVWVMYQCSQKAVVWTDSFPVFENSHSSVRGLFSQNEKRNSKSKIKIISAWRYPGMSPKKNPIPNEILREIKNII